MTPPTNHEALQQKIHAGRRQKLRDRLMKDGLQTFNECEVLEFALGFTIPRQDTNPAAHSLINRFGSLSAVLETDPADLQAAYGIGENAAVFLNFLKQLTSYLGQQKLSNALITCPDQALKYLRPLMHTYAVEELVVICLDHGGKVKNVNSFTNLEFDKIYVNVRHVVSLVMANKAAQVLVAHNHLNEDPQPSVADVNLTRRLLVTFHNLGVKFLDHLIFAGEHEFSFVSSGYMDMLKDHYIER